MMLRLAGFMIAICVSVGAYGEGTNSPAPTPSKKGVELVIMAASSASMNVQEQGEDGNWYWGPPTNRVQFSEDMGKQHAIKAVVGDKTLTCPLRSQDVAYFIENGKRTGRVAVSWYGGCPFQIGGPLVASTDVTMNGECTIEIEDAKDDVLFVSDASTRPIIFKGGQIFTGCEMFQNVVWRFKKPGIEFRAKDDAYKVSKAGATIKFSAKGVEMDGIDKKK